MAEVAFQPFTGELVALPGREVGVPQPGRGRFLAGGQRGQLAYQQAARPAVDGDVVQHEDQYVFLGCQPYQPGAQHRTRGEVERRAGLGFQEGVELGRGEVVEGQIHLARRVDRLDRFGVGPSVV